MIELPPYPTLEDEIIPPPFMFSDFVNENKGRYTGLVFNGLLPQEIEDKIFKMLHQMYMYDLYKKYMPVIDGTLINLEGNLEGLFKQILNRIRFTKKDVCLDAYVCNEPFRMKCQARWGAHYELEYYKYAQPFVRQIGLYQTCNTWFGKCRIEPPRANPNYELIRYTPLKNDAWNAEPWKICNLDCRDYFGVPRHWLGQEKIRDWIEHDCKKQWLKYWWVKTDQNWEKPQWNYSNSKFLMDVNIYTSITDLKDYCRTNGIKGFSKMRESNKSEWVKKIYAQP